MLASKSFQIAIASVTFEIFSNLIQHKARSFRNILSEVYVCRLIGRSAVDPPPFP